MRLAGGTIRTASRTAIAVAGCALAAAAFLTVTVGDGFAAKPRVSSTVSLHTSSEPPDFIFRGRVRSDEGACERRRRVRITAGNGYGASPVEEGIVRTDSEGRYKLVVEAQENTSGNYRATALRKETRRVICRIARSAIDPGA